jgi:hypothetical protein
VVSIAAEPTPGVEGTSATTLGELLAHSYPGWGSLNTQRQQRALQLLGHFNPVLRDSGPVTLSERLPPGPILLPPESVLLH